MHKNKHLWWDVSTETMRAVEEQKDRKQFSQVHQHVILILSAAWILQFKLQCVVSTGPL